jgi:hypothetical protein
MAMIISHEHPPRLAMAELGNRSLISKPPFLAQGSSPSTDRTAESEVADFNRLYFWL